MNQISIAICDADSAYGNKLAEYLLETGNVAKAKVYTDWNSVEADLNGEKRDIWLINSGLLKEAETLPLKKEMVCLAEERLGAREAALPHIYKYQSANVILQEMYARGFEFEPIDIFRAQSRSFQIVDGKLMPSLNSIDGLGEKAADAIVEAAKDGPFLSKDDFRQRTKVSKTIIDLMDSLGLLGDLPESNQISIFDLV